MFRLDGQMDLLVEVRQLEVAWLVFVAGIGLTARGGRWNFDDIKYSNKSFSLSLKS